MSFDWFVDFDVQDKQSVSNCVDSKNGYDAVQNIFSRVKLLATCLSKAEYVKNHARSGKKIDNPTGHKLIMYRKTYNELINKELIKLKVLNLYKPSVDIPLFPLFPLYSFFLQFTFTLATPYISKDDEVFYICDNPVRKDKVFKVPMVSGSNWKGNLRWVMRKNAGLIDENPKAKDSKQIIRLFGNEKGNEKKFRRGRLNFYSTFFNKISLEVINPHDRKTKAGTKPIYIESVPEGATGVLSLLYVPFDLMGNPDAEKVRGEVAKDLRLICKAIRNMMLTYGFSAKKSSGFGIVKNHISIIYKEMNGVEIKVDKKTTKKKEELEQETFDELKKWFDFAIAELEQPAANKGNNNG